MLRELRMKTPDEIKRYQKIISNKDAILADAQAKGDSLVADGQKRQQELVSQHEVMQQAYSQANETITNANKQAQDILDAATTDSNNIRMSAISYTDDMLENMAQIMGNTLSDAGEKYKGFISSLQGCYDVVIKNKQDLAPQINPASSVEGIEIPAVEEDE